MVLLSHIVVLRPSSLSIWRIGNVNTLFKLAVQPVPAVHAASGLTLRRNLTTVDGYYTTAIIPRDRCYTGVVLTVRAAGSPSHRRYAMAWAVVVPHGDPVPGSGVALPSAQP